MSCVEIKIINVDGKIPITIQLTTDNVCELFDKLLTKLSSKDSSIKLDNLIFELSPPIEILEHLKMQPGNVKEQIINYLSTKIMTTSGTTDLVDDKPRLNEPTHMNESVHLDTSDGKNPVNKSVDTIRDTTNIMTDSYDSDEEGGGGGAQQASDIEMHSNDKGTQSKAPLLTINTSVEESSDDPKTPTIFDLGKPRIRDWGSPDSSVVSDTPSYTGNKKLDSVPLIDVMYLSDIECIMREDLPKLTIPDNKAISLLLSLYLSKDTSVIIKNSSEIQMESKWLRRTLLKFSSKISNPPIYDSYVNLWKFTINLLLFNKCIKLFPCKEYLTTHKCDTQFCTYFHQDKDPIYDFMIKQYVINMMEQFSNYQSKNDKVLFDEFSITVINYLFYNRVCRYKNKCDDDQCNKIHNISEQLTVDYLWKTVWKPYIITTYGSSTIKIDEPNHDISIVWKTYYNI